MARIFVMLAVAAAVFGSGTGLVEATPLSSQLSYTDFLKIKPALREREFAALSPESRAAIMRQHLERWLDMHRPDLSSQAQALVRAAIDAVSPTLYSTPPTEAEQQEQVVLGRQLACALGDARASTLMKLDQDPQRVAQGWGARSREWVDWLVNCAGR